MAILKMFRPDGKIDVKYYQVRQLGASLNVWVMGGFTTYNPAPGAINPVYTK